MMIEERDELLIQRCVDDELSPADTRSLLQRLNRLDDGWKSLACGLLEDRNLRRSLQSGARSVDCVVANVARSSSNAIAAPVSTAVTAVARVKRSSRLQHWWVHPVTSLSLCATIAFLGGMLLPGMLPKPDGGVQTANGSVPPTVSALPRSINAGIGDRRAAGSYSIQLGSGGERVDVPVYSGIDDLVHSDRNNPLVSDSLFNSGSERVQWMFVPVGDGRSMLIPMSEDTVGGIQ